jgi:hypothetical protein
MDVEGNTLVQIIKALPYQCGAALLRKQREDDYSRMYRAIQAFMTS